MPGDLAAVPVVAARMFLLGVPLLLLSVLLLLFKESQCEDCERDKPAEVLGAFSLSLSK